MSPHLVAQRVGRLLDRVTDTWLFETLLGDPFTRPVELWLDASNSQCPTKTRVHLDANGHVLSDQDHGTAGR